MDAARLADWWRRGGIEPPSGPAVTVSGTDPVLPARHRPGEMAAAALAAVGAEVADLWVRRGGPDQPVAVDVTAAATTLLGFLFQEAPAGPSLVRERGATIDAYPTADDRWIHLHGGFPHLAAGTLEVLGLPPGREDDAAAVAGAVRSRPADELEDALAAADLCGAIVRTPTEWTTHPQGLALADLPAVVVTPATPAALTPATPAAPAPADGDRPLAGLRVLDLTRVLAGPTCGRTLAEHGADVLRIGAARLPSIEPFVVDTGRGKRNAFLDLDDADDRARFLALVDAADVVVLGYRRGALDRLDLGPEALLARRPGLIVVEVNCYGPVGPWAERRGWEQLAQSAAGIAALEGSDGRPRLLPAAATDYTTGYLAAWGVLAARRRQETDGGGWRVQASLAQTAGWLRSGGADADPATATGLGDVAARQQVVDSPWGPLTHLAPVVHLPETPPRWDRPPAPLGTHEPAWLDLDPS